MIGPLHRFPFLRNLSTSTGVLFLWSCASSVTTGNPAQHTLSHCDSQRVPQGCKSFVPVHHGPFDMHDQLCQCSGHRPGYLLYKQISPTWLTQETDDRVENGTLMDREAALDNWVSEYFASQTGVQLGGPPERGIFDSHSPWAIWPSDSGYVTAFIDDTLLAVRSVHSGLAITPDSLYHEIKLP